MNHKAKRALALLLTAAIVFAMPVISASAAELTFEGNNVGNSTKLTFYVGPYTDTSGYFDDLKSANVKVDLYKVADAVKETVEEGQSDHGSMYVFANMQYGLPASLGSYTGLKALTNENWRALAQSAANTMFGGAVPQPSYSFTASSTDGKTNTLDVAPGLYLVIAHGADLTLNDYKVMNGSNVTTIANSALYQYNYTPELIALPTTVDTMGRVTNETADDKPHVTYNQFTDENGETQTGVSTAGGNWQTTVTALLKPTRENRFGNLTITKNLNGWENSTPATFTFHIVAKVGNSTVYNEFIALTYPTETSRDIDGVIPVDAIVTVTEVDDGSCYDFKGITYSSTDHKIPAPKDSEGKRQALTVTATNEYNHKIIQGYGIENTFKYEGGKWIWYKNGVAQNGGATE